MEKIADNAPQQKVNVQSLIRNFWRVLKMAHTHAPFFFLVRKYLCMMPIVCGCVGKKGIEQ
jgi:hypothetical protein